MGCCLAVPSKDAKAIESNIKEDQSGTNDAVKDGPKWTQFYVDGNGKTVKGKPKADSPSSSTLSVPALIKRESLADRLSRHSYLFDDIVDYDPKDDRKYELMADIVFTEMVKQQNMVLYKGLKEIYDKYTNLATERMPELQLYKSLREFGIFFVDKKLAHDIWKLFDISDEGIIDLTDYQAVVSSFILTKNNKNDPNTNYFFKLFDLNLDGYLNENDIARLLLCLDHISHVINGKSKNEVQLTKDECLINAQLLLKKIDNNCDKISYEDCKSILLSNNDIYKAKIVKLMSQTSIDLTEATPAS